MIPSLILAIYPYSPARFSLSVPKIGLIALIYQPAAPALPPRIGFYTDRQRWRM
ncbi:putative drug efflux protein [Yersinia ruckeri]|nr:putative drug efflux protein [Yersinia ruckeri]